MDNQKNLQMIQSLQIGIQIVELIAQHEHPLKFAEVQELSGVTKSNLYKYLNTLTHFGLLYRDKKQGTYSLGSKLIEYGITAIGSKDVIGTVTPYLREISRHTSLTALLAVWTPGGPVIANIWSANVGLNIGAQIGTLLPLMSASGKIFAAFKDVQDIKEWKLKELGKLSEDHRKLFKEEQKHILKYGFAYAAEPLVSHVSSFSVPIFNYKKDILAALTVVGFSESIPHLPDDEVSLYVINCVKEISNIFGYHPNQTEIPDSI
ncbi:IclR family transcriptional regulator [Bacillus sp. M6-12]|uniref:IclR family transcriptional regulator n=1 Tax=Bacillus sp. M6-12 TaxID=2054166 RepID=UPI000C759F8C|nr:IclR family transcriptional regulator [Bacillus sp. M6-12]PLS18588.1 IclR family transcriptional regulator [Bacillus sp. M6-12]